MEQWVRYQTADGVATVTLDRPDAMNALDEAVKEQLLAAVTEAAEDPAVRAVLLAGTGRAFCVGQDLRSHAKLLASSAEQVWTTVTDHYNPITLALATMPKPVVAAVNGVAAGAGAGFAFACDFRVAARTAGFNLAFAAVGLTADSGTSWTLQRLVGYGRATELLLRPRTIPAEEALALGMVHEVVEEAEVLGRATELVTELAAGPTTAYAALKESLAYSAAHPLPAALEREGELQIRCGTTEDHRNAVEAFLARGKPVFRGR